MFFSFLCFCLLPHLPGPVGTRGFFPLSLPCVPYFFSRPSICGRMYPVSRLSSQAFWSSTERAINQSTGNTTIVVDVPDADPWFSPVGWNGKPALLVLLLVPPSLALALVPSILYV